MTIVPGTGPLSSDGMRTPPGLRKRQPRSKHVVPQVDCHCLLRELAFLPLKHVEVANGLYHLSCLCESLDNCFIAKSWRSLRMGADRHIIVSVSLREWAALRADAVCMARLLHVSIPRCVTVGIVKLTMVEMSQKAMIPAWDMGRTRPLPGIGNPSVFLCRF